MTLVISFILILISPLFSAEIHDAVQEGNLDNIQELIEVDRTNLELQDDRQFTPLNWAVTSGHLEISKYLLNLGADIVMHSATKYLGGHSDVVMGALVVKDKELADKLYFIQNSCGAVCGPMDSFLVLRGIKTLHVRMQRHCENGKGNGSDQIHQNRVRLSHGFLGRIGRELRLLLRQRPHWRDP